ncbi:MAG TPA: hypothetical protein DDZ51_27490 [Planctomycetaceae bacterium]|nr:hypothetical protein [Planctomycetaceae bacterium]
MQICSSFVDWLACRGDLPGDTLLQRRYGLIALFTRHVPVETPVWVATPCRLDSQDRVRLAIINSFCRDTL